MRVGLTSDIHLDPNDRNGKMVEYDGKRISQRILDKLNVLKECSKIFGDNNVAGVVDLGDLCNMLNPPEWLRNLYIKKFITYLSVKKIERLFLIAGNHGTDGANTAFSSLNGMVYNQIKIEFINKKVLVTDGTFKGMYLSPYCPPIGDGIYYNFLEDGVFPHPYDVNDRSLLLIPSDFEDKILFSHMSIAGAKSFFGIDLDGENPVLLNKFKKCILGHFHKPQTIGNITYIGSPVFNTWDETEESEKYFPFKINREYKTVIFDIDTLELEYFPIKERTFIYYKGSFNNFQDDYNKIEEILPECVLRIVLNYTDRSNAVSVSNFIDFLYKNYDIHLIRVEFERGMEEKIVINKRQDHWKDVIEEYAEGNKKKIKAGIEYVDK